MSTMTRFAILVTSQLGLIASCGSSAIGPIDGGPGAIDGGPSAIDGGSSAIDGGSSAIDGGSSAIDGGPPSSLTGWYSDWASQTADLGHASDEAAHDRLADQVGGTNRWSVGVSRRVHGEVVTAPLAALFSHWVEIEFQDSSGSGLFEIITNDLSVIGTDQVQTWRWYESYEQPGNVGATNNHHGIGAKNPGVGELWTQDVSYDNSDESVWVDFFAVPGEGGSVNRKWGVWTNALTSEGNNNFATQYRYTKGSIYMKVVQIRRIGSGGSFRLKIWTYTVDPSTGAHTLLHGPADYRNEDGSSSLADDPELTASDFDLTASFTIGSNGISGTFGYPLPFMHIGGVAVVFDQVAEGTPIGAYGSVIGEEPR